MPTKEKQKEAATFKRFIETKKVLIVDTSSSARGAIFNVLKELGAKTNNMNLTNSFNQAKEAIEKDKPQIVITEYDMGKRCGLELLQSQREQRPEETKDILFVIVTSNTSQTAVARSAEEDVDAYLIKPFTPDVVRSTLMKAALLKIKPPEYLVTIEKGKELLAQGQLDEAEAILNKASKMDPKPSLALYYIGQLQFIKKVLDDSFESYDKGLKFNKIHYKCMVGMYELLMNQKKHVEAYEVVKKISQYFPANPKRLAEVLRLAIITGQYEDIEKYYAVFCNIDERDEMLIKYVCAALVVCGKYYISSKLGYSRALQLFQKAAATGTGRPKIIKEIIIALVDQNQGKEARKFFDKFPPDPEFKDDHDLLNYLITEIDGSNSVIIDMGRELISKGLKDERLYVSMIQRSAAAGLKSAAEEILVKASKDFPAKKAFFKETLDVNLPAQDAPKEKKAASDA